MADMITKETVVTRATPTQRVVQTSAEYTVGPVQTTIYLISFFFGVIEVLLGLRFLFRLMGANPRSGFVNMIYSMSAPLVMPFEGIFRQVSTTGMEAAAVFEPSTLVAMVVYAIIAWGIVQLVLIMARQPVE